MDKSETLNIKDFILEKYTEAKVLEPNLDVTFETEPAIPTCEHGQQKCRNLTYPFASSQLFNVPIKRSKVLLEPNTTFHSKSIMEITLDVENMNGICWQPGDTIAVLPTNSKNDVTILLDLLGLAEKADVNCHIRVNPLTTKKMAKVPMHIPSLSTPREILQDCININSVLKKQFLSSLANYCSDNDEQLFLKCLSSKEASTLYNDLILGRGFTILDILKICHSCKPPLNLIIEHFARLLPRPYSITNSRLENSREINIIFSILNEKPGITTSMMVKKTKENTSVLLYLREPNSFRYTEEDFSKNQIFIAIGTGLAPFLGFLQHKHHLKSQGSNGEPGQSWLFVGATTEQAILYREQLVQWETINILNKFVEAHSRSASSVNQYVQDALVEYSREIVDLLLQSETVLYLCADGGDISRCIEKSMVNIIEKELLVSDVEALQMLKEFRVKGKYREDLWI